MKHLQRKFKLTEIETCLLEHVIDIYIRDCMWEEFLLRILNSSTYRKTVTTFVENYAEKLKLADDMCSYNMLRGILKKMRR